MSEEHPQDPPSAPERGSPGHQHAHSHLPTFTFLEELKRRNVGRVAILYIILGYVVLEVFGVFVHLLDLPPWVGRSAVLLVVLGFPIALLIAWIYEITPEGLKPTDQVAPHKSIRHLTGRRLDRAIIAVLAFALSYFVIDKFWLSSHRAVATPTQSTRTTPTTSGPSAAAISEKSVAVLPFVDMSETKDQEYFADGMTEDLLDLLSRVADLRVIARTSSFAFKGKSEDIRAIAAQLGVANLIEGSVRKSGNTLRVTAQLIHASDGTHFWSRTYDRKTGDIFKIQDSIASAVVEELKISLLPSAMPKASGTENIDSFSLETQARAMFRLANSRNDLVRVDEYLQHSLKLDPENVRAWSTLANLRFYQANMGLLPTGVNGARAWQEAREAARNAIKFGPSNVAGYRALQNILFFHDWNWSAADEQIQHVLAINPNDAWARTSEAFKFWIAGEVEKAIPFQRAALDNDPLWREGWVQLSIFYRVAGHLDEAQNAIRRALDINPEGVMEHGAAAEILFSSGNSAAALAEIDKVSDLEARVYSQAVFYCRLGQKNKADAALTYIKNKLASPDALGLAEIYACRGEKDLAFQWLDRAYAQHEVNLVFLKTDEDLLRLHDDQRWRALLNRMNIPI